jgi:hypothetical protein
MVNGQWEPYDAAGLLNIEKGTSPCRLTRMDGFGECPIFNWGVPGPYKIFFL